MEKPQMKCKREVVNNKNKRVGTLTRFDTLTKIANERQAQDGSEKKKKLTNHEGTIICKNEKHYRAYDYITSERRESLETIK